MSIDLGPKLGLVINGNSGDVCVDQIRPFFRFIDALMLGNILNATTTVPPTAPNNGDAYLLLGTPTGVWTSHANAIAVYSVEITVPGSNTKTPGWDFWTPNNGWTVYDTGSRASWIYLEGAWTQTAQALNLTVAQKAVVGTDVNAQGNINVGGGLQVAGGLGLAYRSIAANSAALVTDHTIAANATAGAITVSLPDAVAGSSFNLVAEASFVTSTTATPTGRVFVIKKSDASANTVTVSPAVTGQLIDTAATVVLSQQGQFVVVQSNGSGYAIIGQSTAGGSLLTLASSITPTFNWAQGKSQKMVMPAGSALVAFAGATPGDEVRLIVQQDTVGGRLVSWAANILGVSAASWAASKSGVFEFLFDGTNYLSMGMPLVGM